ncbi:MAG: hypothetical protein ACLGGX_05570 [Bdellovibrionia bacterium]
MIKFKGHPFLIVCLILLSVNVAYPNESLEFVVTEKDEANEIIADDLLLGGEISEKAKGNTDVKIDQDPTEEEPTKEISSTPSEKPEQNPFLDGVSKNEITNVTCDAIYLEMIKKLPPKKQKQFQDAYFEWSKGYEYLNDKNDEFAWKDKESTYTLLFSQLLAQEKEFLIYANFKLGKYDFNKKGFPLEISWDKSGFLKSFSRSHYGVGPIGGPVMGGSYTCFKDNAYKDAPSIIHIKPKNLKSFNFLPISEDKAQKIVAQLTGDRLAFATIKISINKITSKNYDPLRLKVKETLYDTEATAKSVQIHVGSTTLDEIPLK